METLLKSAWRPASQGHSWESQLSRAVYYVSMRVSTFPADKWESANKVNSKSCLKTVLEFDFALRFTCFLPPLLTLVVIGILGKRAQMRTVASLPVSMWGHQEGHSAGCVLLYHPCLSCLLLLCLGMKGQFKSAFFFSMRDPSSQMPHLKLLISSLHLISPYCVFP